jgi:methyl-accepting chemotaxis protein
MDPEALDAALWAAHHEARRRAAEASEVAPKVADAAARHRAMLDGASERASAMAAHAEGLTLAATRVGDLFERLSIVALNAGLEGSRAAQPQGKALLLISEEVKGHAARGAEAARDLVAVVEEIAGETSLLRKDLAGALAAADVTGQTARSIGAVLGGVESALEETDRLLRRATGVDPEVSRAIALAAEHARGLFAALSTLRAATQARPVLLRVLRPALAPLARLLRELDEPARGDEGARASTPPPPGDDDGKGKGREP